jgi:aspartyl protease family protein
MARESRPVLRTTLWFAVILLGVSAAAVVGLRGPAPGAGAKTATTANATATANGATNGLDDTLVLTAGPGGHYFVDAEINGETIRFLVDTGASVVALSRGDAERIGFDVNQLDFTGRARTANGIARIARVTIDEIEIDDNAVRNVPASVIDAPMDMSLLGMSFLSRLAGYQVQGNRLILRW